jgi:hypothetical protein
MDMKGVSWRVLGKDPLSPTLLSVRWFTKYVIGALITFSQFSTDQDTVTKFQSP